MRLVAQILVSFLMTIILLPISPTTAASVLIEAEGFKSWGGWVVDQQFMDQMGSPFLLAHGLAVPVADAMTTVEVPRPGKYRVWVRTRDWVAQWNAPEPEQRSQMNESRCLTCHRLDATEPPGRFQLVVNGKALPTIFGAEGAKWHWQDGGTIEIPDKNVTLVLHDLAGFDGRCDAIVLTTEMNFVPPNQDSAMAEFRRKMLGLPDQPQDAGRFDLVVIGGGMAGTCAAISAARLGLQVALIQDRPVLGGNNSSEVRVHLNGQINLPPYPRLGDVVKELDSGLRGNAQPPNHYDDGGKLAVVRGEKNLHLFLNMHVFKTEILGNRIKAVVAKHIETDKESRFAAPMFADCTGDGTVGFLAGADFRMGRESKAETGESLTPEKPDKMTMGASVQWYSVETNEPRPFPDCLWALKFTEQSRQYLTRGDWDWETGLNRDQISDFEHIRDHGLRAVFGNWAYLKNHSDKKAEYANRKLEWVAYIAGKRESRRLLGDVILCQQDIEEQREFPDAFVTTTWTIDLHYPEPKNSEQFPRAEFRTIAKHLQIKPYPIPYRCLYSRNIENLFMAGRNISVTHVALGTTRVMRTCGMMGELVGMAASLCKEHNTIPRGVYENHIKKLKELASRGVGQHQPSATVMPATRTKEDRS